MRSLLGMLAPEPAAVLLSAHNIIQAWILDVWYTQKAESRAVISESSSMIPYTLDLWTSCNDIPMLGVVAHYVSAAGRLCVQVLTLREVEGSHSGENIHGAFQAVVG